MLMQDIQVLKNIEKKFGGDGTDYGSPRREILFMWEDLDGHVVIIVMEMREIMKPWR